MLHSKTENDTKRVISNARCGLIQHWKFTYEICFTKNNIEKTAYDI